MPYFHPEGKLFRQCQVKATIRKGKELRALKRQSAPETYVPDAEYPKQPYGIMVTFVHNSMGFMAGVCLCMKDVQVRRAKKKHSRKNLDPDPGKPPFPKEDNVFFPLPHTP